MDAQTITIIVTLVGVLKGMEAEIKELKQKYEDLILRFQTKALKSRGKRNEVSS